MTTNAEHVRGWLLGCAAIDGTKGFGVDYLGDEATRYALMTVASPLRWEENILGARHPAAAQAQDFLFVSRERYGADVPQNLRNLTLLQAVADWIAARNAAGEFPRWEGGVVTGVTPTVVGAPVAFAAGMARYQLRIRVDYRIV